ncbi:MAG TPA: sigma factor-like helix-turn-helix DNA-binding protein [Candidatus Saccharimonadales bacterium]|nr:sigma factor-like helix-turn-helix DNA-binding protein [Candidatus Saccharimonadales bacterium]
MNQKQGQPPSFEVEPGSENIPHHSEPGLRLVSLRESIATDFMNPQAELEQTEKEEFLNRALGLLNDKNRQLINLRFGFEEEAETQASTAQIMGVTRQNAHQMEARALKALGQLLERDITEEGIEQQVRESTPIVISSDPEVRRYAKNIGYEVYGNRLIGILKELVRISLHEEQRHIVQDSEDMEKTLLLERLSGIKIPRDMSKLSQKEKRLLASNIVKTILKRAGHEEKPEPSED